MEDTIVKNKIFPIFRSQPWVSLLYTTIFFIFYLFLLRPGYGINDDLKMISIVAGYPGAVPAPFLVYSNALIGFFLMPLYALNTIVNWEIIIFVIVNFLSVWSLLHISLTSSPQFRLKLFGGMVILACDAYILLNITFTTIAAFACLSGICLILAVSRSSITPNKGYIVTGTALIFIGSLIRLEMLPLCLSMALPALYISRRIFNFKNLAITCTATVLLVAAGYAFNRIYLHFSPDWQAYNIYDKTRVQIDDTHRLENMHSEIHFVGWSGNDQELFAHWFFPDKKIYSLGHIQYLVENISGISSNKIRTALDLFDQFISPGSIPYIFFIISIGLWMYSQGFSKELFISLTAIASLFLVDNLYLAWAWKIADRTIYSALITAAVLSLMFLVWHSDHGLNFNSSLVRNAGITRIPFYGSILFWAVALALVLNQSFQTTRNNINKQAAYQKILIDLNALRSSEAIPRNSLIISPAHGLPMEWSNPFVLIFPTVPYLDTGWITFSPPYEQVLREYDIQYLPDALYQKNNIYLMTRAGFTVFLGRYYKEHENISVEFRPIYNMPNTYEFAGYDDIKLYQVVKSE